MLQIEDFGELVVGEGGEEDEHGEVVFLVEGTVVGRTGGVFAVGDEVADGHHHADSECYQEYPVSCHIQSAYKCDYGWGLNSEITFIRICVYGCEVTKK